MNFSDDLTTPYTLSEADLTYFRENGFVKLKNVLSPALLDYYGAAIARYVAEKSRHYKPLNERDTYGKAFLQIGNIWQHDPLVKEFVFSQRLGKIAADLLGIQGVRIYHDQALFKEAGGGHTPWHVDQHYWPMATDRSITAWIPLQETPVEMGPVQFAAGSQRMELGRNLAISDDSEREIDSHMKLSDFQMVNQPYEFGDISFHLGWTFHRAGANQTDRPRNAMTIIYMDEQMRLAAPKNKSQESDRAVFMPGLEPGDLCDTPITPVIYSHSA